MKKTLLPIFACLTFFFLNLNAKGQTVLYTEDFASGALPSGWTNDSVCVTPLNVWLFDNPYLRTITGGGFDTDFAIFDSDEASTNDSIEEYASLTTADINVSSATGAVYLELDEQYRALAGPGTDGSSKRIEYSTDAGATWTTAVYDSMDFGYPVPAHAQYAMNLTGAANVRIRFTWTGTWDWWWAIDNVEIIDYPVTCATPPNAGTAASSFTTACPFNVIDLYLEFADSSTGFTYQWQVSTDNVNWTDITGATSSSYSLSGQAQASYYLCNITCGGLTGTSAVVAIGQNAPLDCYCIPEYLNGCDALGKVAVNTLLNVSVDCNGILPENYTLWPDTGSLTTDLGTGDYYDVTIASGPGSGMHGAGIWFDFNADGDFQDAGEYTHVSDTIPELSGDFITNINIPVNAVLGPTRMRVRYIYSTFVTSTDDCSTNGFGETEDYTVNVVLGTGVKNNPLQSIKVYPVPANDRIFVQSPVQGSMQITLLDQTGRICRNIHSASNSLEINTSDLSAGIYFIRFETENNTLTRKIVLN